MTKARLNRALTFTLAFVGVGIIVVGNIVLLLFREAKLQQTGPWVILLFIILAASGFAFGWKKRNR
jgi:hypothetical protein